MPFRVRPAWQLLRHQLAVAVARVVRAALEKWQGLAKLNAKCVRVLPVKPAQVLAAFRPRRLRRVRPLPLRARDVKDAKLKRKRPKERVEPVKNRLKEVRKKQV